MSSPSSRHRPLAGFTLLELTTTVAICVTLASIATARLDGMLEQEQDRMEVRKVVNALLEARSLARSRLESVTVEVSGTDTLVLTPSSSDARSYTFDLILTPIPTNADTLVFDSSGGTTELEPTVVSLQSARGATYQIVVYPAIGAVRLL